jgi:threonine/homoserine/homoserine lactone efflux protein
LAGGAYLVFLGVQTLRAAVSGRVERARRAARGGARVRLRTAYRQGLLSNLSNPKIGAFFTSLLPQFGPSGHASFAMLMLLGGIFCLLTLTWLTAYAAAVSHARRLLSRPLVRRAIDAITGVVLIAFGARVAAARR